MTIEERENKMRAAFLEIEHLVAIHRECNRLPTLGASDILDAAKKLYEAAVLLRASESPLIDADGNYEQVPGRLIVATANSAASSPESALPDSTSGQPEQPA